MIHATIRKKRRDLEMSQTELAELSGCTQSTIANFEKGRSGISSKTLEKIYLVLDINI